MIMQNGAELSRLKPRPAAQPRTRPAAQPLNLDPNPHDHAERQGIVSLKTPPSRVPRPAAQPPNPKNTNILHTPDPKPSNSPASTPKNEVNSPHQTKPCSGEIPSQLLFPKKDVESCKGDEGDDFLDDFELR